MSECRRFICHAYCRSEGQPHIGSFIASTRAEALNAAFDVLVANKIAIDGVQMADALDAWQRGEENFEVDEDGLSFAFMNLCDGDLVCEQRPTKS